MVEVNAGNQGIQGEADRYATTTTLTDDQITAVGQSGTTTITVAANLAYTRGQIVRVGDANAFFIGVVASYSGTGLEINVTESTGTLSNSVPYDVNLSGGTGTQGAQGIGIDSVVGDVQTSDGTTSGGTAFSAGDTLVTVNYNNPGEGAIPDPDQFIVEGGQTINAFDTGFQSGAIEDRITRISAGENINIREDSAISGGIIISVGTDQPDTFHGHINDFSLTQGADGTATSGTIGVLHASGFTYTITTIDVGNSLLLFNVADDDQTFTISTQQSTQPGTYRLVAEVVSDHGGTTNNERIPFNVTVIAHTAQVVYYFGEIPRADATQAISDGTPIDNSLLTASTVSLQAETLLVVAPTTESSSFILNVDNDEVTRLNINTATDFTFGAGGAGLQYTPPTAVGTTFTSYIFPVNTQGGTIRFR